MILLKFRSVAIHIGKIIKQVVKSKGISVTDFAEKINYSRRNVYEIFDKETIDTGLLIKIGKVLQQNLFLYYITENEILELAMKNINREDLMTIVLEIREAVKSIKSNTNYK